MFNKGGTMKDKVIEIAGRTWHELGSRGEATSRQIASSLREDEALVNMALGWLAREDKVRYSQRRNDVMFSLVESELGFFKDASTSKGVSQRPQKSIWRKLLTRV